MKIEDIKQQLLDLDNVKVRCGFVIAKSILNLRNYLGLYGWH